MSSSLNLMHINQSADERFIARAEVLFISSAALGQPLSDTAIRCWELACQIAQAAVAMVISQRLLDQCTSTDFQVQVFDTEADQSAPSQ